MKEVLADNALSPATVYRWVAKLKRGRQSNEDEHRSGRPVEASTDEDVESVQEIIVKDRRLTIRHVAECLKSSTGTIHHIISEIVGYNRYAHVVCPDC